MAIPDKIKISHIEGYYTEDIGRYGSGNQFMAFVVATLPEVFSKDWEQHKRWYAVLHTFDAEGNHLDTQCRFAGVTADGEEQITVRARGWVGELMSALGPVIGSDVEAKLFSVQVDGHTFGLVDVSCRDEEDDTFNEEVSLLPNEFVFYEPWDGDYDT